jgi:replicative DNA helicase
VPPAGKPGLVVIDYLAADDLRRRRDYGENRQQVVSDISRR